MNHKRAFFESGSLAQPCAKRRRLSETLISAQIISITAVNAIPVPNKGDPNAEWIPNSGDYQQLNEDMEQEEKQMKSMIHSKYEMRSLEVDQRRRRFMECISADELYFLQSEVHIQLNVKLHLDVLLLIFQYAPTEYGFVWLTKRPWVEAGRFKFNWNYQPIRGHVSIDSVNWQKVMKYNRNERRLKPLVWVHFVELGQLTSEYRHNERTVQNEMIAASASAP